jgi:hypothetical protein
LIDKVIKIIFTQSDLNLIKENTEYNNHTENYIFIAHKLNEKTLENKLIKFEKDNPEGYDGLTYAKLGKVKQSVLNKLKKKSPNDYGLVHNRL